MGYKLREIAAESKFSQELALDAIARAVPLSEIRAALTEEAVCEQRERKLNMVMTVLVTIAMNLYARISIGEVLHKIAKGLRYIWPDPDYPVAKANAFSYRRYQLGPRPLVNLFQRVCRPMATHATPGAFLFGLCLMAIDGAVEDVPDTAENVAAFGRHPGDRGDTAPFHRCRPSTWPNVAPTPLWMRGSGRAGHRNGWAGAACYARSRPTCWSCGIAVSTASPCSTVCGSVMATP